MAKPIKFYIEINGTNLRCDKIPSLKEIIGNNFNDLIIAVNKGELPLMVLVEQPVMDKINLECSKSAVSKYHMKVVKIYANINSLYLRSKNVAIQIQPV